MKITKLPIVAASGGILLSGSKSEAFSVNRQSGVSAARLPAADVSARASVQTMFRASDMAMRNPAAHKASRACLSKLKQSSHSEPNSEHSGQIPKPVPNPNKLGQLLPVEQFMGWEGSRSLPVNKNPFKQNYFPRLNVPGMGVSAHWPSRVKNLADKGPFPVQRQLLDCKLSSGKTISVVIDYPTQKELGNEGKLPVVFYNPPGFIGEVPLPAGKLFYDAQIGFPFMEHLASYGMVSVTLLEPGSVLLDGVESVNHKQQAQELNEIIDQIIDPECLPTYNMPAIEPNRIGVLAYSRGAKVGLLAAAERIEKNKRNHSQAKVVSVAKDPVNLGGVPPAVLSQIPKAVRQCIPEDLFKSWEESSFRHPLAPLPDDEGQTDSEAQTAYPIEAVTDPVLVFQGQVDWINPYSDDYGASRIFQSLPKQEQQENLLVEVTGGHESWVNDYGVKGDSMAVMTAYFLTHLADRQEFSEFLKPEALLKAPFGTIKSVANA